MMNWNQLLSTKRLGLEDYHSKDADSRTEYQRDYDRIIFSSSFRRLQNKTQVFPLPQRIYVHNRLTHSLEVSSVGRSLGSMVSRKLTSTKDAPGLVEELGGIVAAACLVHDIGNPPFGHSGEKVISSYFKDGEGHALLDRFSKPEQSDVLNFEGNANAFRLLTQQFEGKRKGGFVLTYSTLASIVKYPYSSIYSKGKKFGYFQSEQDIFERIAQELGLEKKADGSFYRHPLVYLVEAADDICYQVMDMEDAYKLGLLTLEEIKKVFLRYFDEEADAKVLASIERTLKRVLDENEQMAYLRTMVIGKLVNACAETFVNNEAEILKGNFEGTLVKRCDDYTYRAYKESASLALNRIYRSQEVIEVELAGFKIIRTLMEVFCDAVVSPEKSYSSHIMYFIPKQFRSKEMSLYEKVRGIIDFVSGMTDLYALDLYRKVTGMSLPQL